MSTFDECLQGCHMVQFRECIIALQRMAYNLMFYLYYSAGVYGSDNRLEM